MSIAPSSSDSPQPHRHRRTANGRVRTIEYSRRAVSATEVEAPNYGRFVGRVGALALLLGVGSAVSLPVAYADSEGSAGSSRTETSASTDAPASTSTPKRESRATRRNSSPADSSASGTDPSASGAGSSASGAGSARSAAAASVPSPARRSRSSIVPAGSDVSVPETSVADSVVAPSSPVTAVPRVTAGNLSSGISSWLGSGGTRDRSVGDSLALASVVASRPESDRRSSSALPAARSPVVRAPARR